MRVYTFEMPLPGSVADRLTATVVTYQPFAPAVPETEAVVEGGVVSIAIV